MLRTYTDTEHATLQNKWKYFHRNIILQFLPTQSSILDLYLLNSMKRMAIADLNMNFQ